MVDPRLPSDRVELPYATRPGIVAWLTAEIWDHLWPWSRAGFQTGRALQGAGLALGLAASVVWILAGLGHMQAGAVIAWWFGWSVFEVVVRLGAKPYVKEGPWWGRCYRRAGRMDMLCYVGFKNLLIGAALFIALKSLGALVV
ncbi:MAG: transcription regulator [Rhodocyclaceae bacterium]|nr:transcription regulator [Rhodocyclaceae bacterium]MBX3668063.1 transcription regulator [Rhodocyclaceae bacterium]